MGRAERRPPALRVARRLQPARRARRSKSTLELPAPATALDAVRASGVLERYPELDLGEPSDRHLGPAARPTPCSPTATGSRSTGRCDGSEGGAPAARRKRARAARAAERGYLQSAAITSRVRCDFVGALLVVEELALAVLALVWARRMPLSSVAQLRLARGCSCRRLARRDRSCSALVLAAASASAFLRLASSSGSTVRRRDGCAAERRAAPTRRRRGAARRRASAQRRARAGEDVLVGIAGGGGRSLYWTWPPLSRHFHCASAGKGEDARRESGEQSDERSGHGRDSAT